MKRYMILGASRGLGHSFAHGLPKGGDEVILVSRTEPDMSSLPKEIHPQWIGADLSKIESIDALKKDVGDKPIDVLIYNAGIWETKRFEETSREDIAAICNVNFVSALYAVQQFIGNIKASKLKKIVLVGSTAGLENEGAKSVTYTATKFALRGMCHSLRENYREDGIGITVLNLGGMATDIAYTQGAQEALSQYKNTRIPVDDVINLVKCLISLSPASTIKEIDMPAQFDADS